MKGSISKDRFDAVLFDLDGVLTSTARIHAETWKTMFDEYLSERAARTGETFRPFIIASDYPAYADGRPRFDGVREFLKSRGIELPEGDPGDPPGAETVCGLGNRKNELVLRKLDQGGVEAYPGSVRLVKKLREAGIRTAVVSASHNAEAVLAAAGIGDLFELRVDGNDQDREGFPGKPEPDPFLTAARRLGVEPGRAVVVEDALAGVKAGKAGGFGLVIGVDRHGEPEALSKAGADLVVSDLEELL